MILTGKVPPSSTLQGSGKSSLLNEMLGTHFPVQPTSAPGTCTTFGAVIEMAKGIVAIDLEGNYLFKLKTYVRQVVMALHACSVP